MFVRVYSISCFFYGDSVLITDDFVHTSTNIVSPMAKSRQSLVQDKIGDLTKCSICKEIFTDPKILPCVHTFCLHCLETYGKDKQPGDKITCPNCRNNFEIPTGGLCKLPNNFFIGEMVEIGKLSMAPVNEAMCNICPEGEELVAKMYCIDCEQILCERCSKSHKKIKFSQNHQVVELGSKLNAENFNLRNSYWDHHPRQLITMYCTEQNIAICLICCVESHQSHRCVNVEKAAGDFTKQLTEDLKNVTRRLPKCEEVEQKLDKYQKEFLEQISKTEKSIRETGTKLKMLIDQHTEILVKRLKLLKETNLKAFEITKQDINRFRVMIDSYARYSEELLSRGSPVDICRAADQMRTRANELETLPSNCSGDRFHCDAVAFQPSSFEKFLKQCKSSNAVGDLTVTTSPGGIIDFEVESTAGLHCKVFSPGILQISVRAVEKTSFVTLHTNAKVDELFRIVCKQCANGLRPEDIALVFEDKVLEYNKGKTLQDYEIAHLSTVTVIVRLAG